MTLQYDTTESTSVLTYVMTHSAKPVIGNR